MSALDDGRPGLPLTLFYRSIAAVCALLGVLLVWLALPIAARMQGVAFLALAALWWRMPATLRKERRHSARTWSRGDGGGPGDAWPP